MHLFWVRKRSTQPLILASFVLAFWWSKYSKLQRGEDKSQSAIFTRRAGRLPSAHFSSCEWFQHIVGSVWLFRNRDCYRPNPRSRSQVKDLPTLVISDHVVFLEEKSTPMEVIATIFGNPQWEVRMIVRRTRTAVDPAFYTWMASYSSPKTTSSSPHRSLHFWFSYLQPSGSFYSCELCFQVLALVIHSTPCHFSETRKERT